MFGNTLLESFNQDESFDKFVKDMDDIDYHTFYRGEVIDNNDPLKLGRVRVRIVDFHGTKDGKGTYTYLNSSSLPWATPGNLTLGYDSGSYLLPNIGDMVFIAFEGGDEKLPIYFGGILTKREGDTKDVGSNEINNLNYYQVLDDDLIKEIKTNNERVIYKSLKGAIIIIDDSDGKESIRITDQSGQSIIMENLSNKNLPMRGDTVGKNSKSQIVLTNNVGSSISIKNDTIHLKSKKLIIETDETEEIGYDTDYSNEIELADRILGIPVIPPAPIEEFTVRVINDTNYTVAIGKSTLGDSTTSYDSDTDYITANNENSYTFRTENIDKVRMYFMKYNTYHDTDLGLDIVDYPVGYETELESINQTIYISELDMKELVNLDILIENIPVVNNTVPEEFTNIFIVLQDTNTYKCYYYEGTYKRSSIDGTRATLKYSLGNSLSTEDSVYKGMAKDYYQVDSSIVYGEIPKGTYNVLVQVDSYLPYISTISIEGDESEAPSGKTIDKELSVTLVKDSD